MVGPPEESGPAPKFKFVSRGLRLVDLTKKDAGLHKVVDRLYLSSVGGVLNKPAISDAHITHVACVADGLKKKPNEDPIVEHVMCKIQDSVEANLLVELPELLTFINRALCADPSHRVLVYSFQGTSRAVAVCAAYLMFWEGASLESAMDTVVKARPSAAINAGFAAQLEAFVTALDEGDDGISLPKVTEAALVLVRPVTLEECNGRASDPGRPGLGIDDVDENAAATDSKEQGVSLEQMGTMLQWLQAAKQKAAQEEDFEKAAQIKEKIATLEKAIQVVKSQGTGPSAASARQKLKELESQKAAAIAADDFETAARIRDQMKQVEGQIAAAESSAAKQPKPPAEPVSDADLAAQLDGLKSVLGNLSKMNEDSNVDEEAKSQQLGTLKEMVGRLAKMREDASPEELAAREGARKERQEKLAKMNPEERKEFKKQELDKLLTGLKELDAIKKPEVRKPTWWEKGLLFILVCIFVLVGFAVLNAILLRALVYFFGEQQDPTWDDGGQWDRVEM